MVAVPAFLKLMKTTLDNEIKQYGPFKKAFFNFKYALAKIVNNKTFSKILFRELNLKFGGRFKGFMSGGAPLDISVAKFFETIGIRIYEAYGLSEASPIITMNTEKHRKLGSVGRPIHGVKVRIDSKTHELQIMGENIMKGYYNNPEATAEVLTEDCWLNTGDVGHQDSDGYLYLTGRAKNVIVTEGGKNVFPEEVEDPFQLYDEIDQVCVLGYLADRSMKREGIRILIVPSKAYIDSVGGDKAAIEKHMNDIVDTVNRSAASHKRITRVDVIYDQLPLTSTKKVKRGEVIAKYGD